MKNFYFLLAVLGMFTGLFAQTTLTEWAFENQNLTPSKGSGTIGVAGGVTDTGFVAGNSSASGWSTTSYPAQGTSTRTAGVLGSVSTLQYYTIAVTYDIYVDSEASQYYQFEYSTDGTNWTVSTGPFKIQNVNNWVTRSETLSSVADNNSALYFRVVSVFDPTLTTDVYAASGTYSPSGKVSFDNIRVTYGSTTLGVKDVSKALQSVLLKNTVVDQVLMFGTKSDVKIYNINGQVVKTASVKEGTQLDLSGLQKGIYLITGDVSGNKVSAKIIKR